jgi:hypothetical protein
MKDIWICCLVASGYSDLNDKMQSQFPHAFIYLCIFKGATLPSF